MTDLAGRTLLDRAVGSLPPNWPVVVVGPPRTLHRPVTFVAEEPPGSGPGAALVRGARAALAAGAPIMVSLPGDAPEAGAGAVELVDRLLAEDDRFACVGCDADSRDQPLQLAVRGAALHALAGVADSTGIRARDLLPALPGLHRVPLAPAALRDLDTREQAAAWVADLHLRS